MRLDKVSAGEREHLLKLPCPTYPTTPWVPGPELSQARVAMISTAGLHCRGDRPFEMGAADYRIIPADTPAGDIVMSHASANYDRTGYQQDLNVVLPVDRLRELAEANHIGGVAAYHYSFMGATEPEAMENAARSLAGIMLKAEVNTVLLVPV